jgi:hypothetical protein
LELHLYVRCKRGGLLRERVRARGRPEEQSARPELIEAACVWVVIDERQEELRDRIRPRVVVGYRPQNTDGGLIVATHQDTKSKMTSRRDSRRDPASCVRRWPVHTIRLVGYKFEGDPSCRCRLLAP